jgi:ABC-type transport system involved in multi-copper enzyme maturation permease subunit
VLRSFDARAGCIVRERHQKTLESLLLLPITAGDLLARKWLGAVLCYRFYLVLLVCVLLLSVLVGVVHPIGAVLVLLAILIHVSFLVSLGMGVSAAAQKPIEAHFVLAILLVLVFAGPWWWLGLSNMQPSNWWFAVLEVGVNPVGSWNFLLFNWKDLRAGDELLAHKLQIAALGLCAYGAAAIGLLLATRLGFRRVR